jgi:hypothetical protein
MFTLINTWLKRIDKYLELEDQYNNLLRAHNEQSKVVISLESDLDTCNVQLKKYNTPTIFPKKDVNDAEYWNSKWKQTRVFYAAPKRKWVCDYLKFSEVDKEICKGFAEAIIDQYPTGSPDQCIKSLMVWRDEVLEKLITYKLDQGEKWYSVEEIMIRREDDCDGWGTLLYGVARELFKMVGLWDNVVHRLKCVAGNVNRFGTLPSPAGGHFYLIWLAEDGEWYRFESTYYRGRDLKDFLKKPMKLESAYGTIWFTFNEEQSWSQHSIVISKNDFKKN